MHPIKGRQIIRYSEKKVCDAGILIRTTKLNQQMLSLAAASSLIKPTLKQLQLPNSEMKVDRDARRG
ncbi:MAG: hypothetical protein ACRD3Q_10545, partial [Terriglobales bacterium]